jgi:hypothetical protein
MTACTNCPNRPRCEYSFCGDPADRSILVPTWQKPMSFVPTFFCKPCAEYFKDAWAKPMRGIDRPQHADEDWRPSIAEMMRHASIAIEFEQRHKHTKALDAMGSLRRPGDERYSAAQLRQMLALRKGLRNQRFP